MRRLIASLTALQSLGNWQVQRAIDLSLVCSGNVQVLRCSFVIPVGVPFWERVNFGQCLTVELATVLAGAAKQGASRPADEAALPARVLFAGIALPTLQKSIAAGHR